MRTGFPILAASVLVTVSGSSTGEPLFEDRLVVAVKKGLHGPRGMNGDFVQLNDGSLLFAYTENGITARRSQDQGRTFSAPDVIVPDPKPPVKGRYAHPSFLRLANGEILLSYIYSTHPLTPYYAHNYYRRSADDGATWSDQYLMTPQAGYVIVHNDRLFTLSSGRIVAMAEYKAHYPSSRDHSGYVGMSFYSDNLGQTWYPSRNTVDLQPVEVQEAGAVELKDGRVLMFARTYSGHPVFAWSEDGCETWSEGQMNKAMSMPYAGLPTVKRIPSTGDLLFLWISEKSVEKVDGKDIARRCALTSAVSRDEGQTFEHLRHIARDPQDDFGYQCVEFVGADVTLVGYHARDGLHVARIGTDWFYGK